MKISKSDISDAFDLINSINDALQPVPYLGPVLQICNNILQAVQGIGANQEAMKKLSDYATLFVKSLVERSRNNTSFSDSLRINIDAVNDLYDKIKLFVEKEAAKSFLKQALGQSKTADKIQEFSTQISQLAQSLQVAVAFDSNSLILAVQKDTHQLVEMMLAIKNNNQAMNKTMDEILDDAKLQNQKLETLESIAETIQDSLKSLPNQIHGVMRKMLSIAQKRIQKSAGRKLAPRFDWTISHDDVDIEWNVKIGEGSYGTIYRAVYRDMQVAVKVIDKTHVDQQAADDIEKEASIWYPLRDPNILLLWGLCMNVEKPFLVMPMMKCDLSRHIKSHPDLDMQTRIQFIASIANGMKYLHTREFPIVHGDLKANNVLIGFDDEICITDFGLAFIKTQSKSNTKRRTEAARWIAPEKYKKGYKLSPPSDVFAFAMTCIEIITGEVPFPERTEENIVKHWIEKAERPSRPDNVPDYLWSLIEDCWRQDPSQRPTFIQIVNRLKNPMYIRIDLAPFKHISELKPNPPQFYGSDETLARQDDHLMPYKNPSSPPSRARSRSLSIGSFNTIEIRLSLEEQLVRYEILGATRIGIDRGDPEDCKEAIEIISTGKPVSDECWDVVVCLYKKAFRSGDDESCFELAWLYFAGAGVEKNDMEALAYWKRVVRRSNDVVHKTISTYMVGLCYYLGIGAEKDLVKGWNLINESWSDEFVLAGQWAFDWVWGKPIDKIQSSSHVSKVFFEQVKFGSENNNLMKHLEGVCHFYGFGVKKDYKKAVDIFTSLGGGGFAASQVMLGSCYFLDGVPKDRIKAANWMRKAADQENAYAQFNLGYCYYYGYGVPQHHRIAADWYRKAADQGHVQAQYELGCRYVRSEGVPEDYGKAVEWWQKAADQGHVGAQYWLGYCYHYGQGVPQDYGKAIEHWQRLAERGHAAAQYNLGLCYRNGKGVEHDHDKTVEYFKQSAERGHVDAQYELGCCYRDGKDVTQDDVQAAEWFRKAAEHGDADGQCCLGICYRDGCGVPQDPALAVEWFQKAADQGYAHGQVCLGDCYYKGKGVPQDYVKAVEWFQKAAEQGHAGAQLSVGDCYRDGCGVPQDYEKAVEWYQISAKQGHVDAQAALGHCYHDGVGVQQDYVKAVELFQKAADQGHAGAKVRLGFCYRNGRGVKQDQAKAVEWFQKASDEGFDET